MNSVGEKMHQLRVWKGTLSVWAFFMASLLLLGILYYEGLFYMVEVWNKQEEYSHGFLIPVISIFFVWLNKNRLEQLPFEGSWAGVFLLALGVGLFVLGEGRSRYPDPCRQDDGHDQKGFERMPLHFNASFLWGLKITGPSFLISRYRTE